MSKKVLVLEDNEEILDLLQLNFEMKGYQVISYFTPKRVSEVDLEDLDLIFTDINMPEQNGVDWALEIREKGYNHPIIFYTGLSHNENIYKEKLVKVGNYKFLHKPVSFKKIEEAIEEIGSNAVREKCS